ncbi:hypothetical protein FOA52_015185 [Chlamydomonas sp. UWO 241]|nr:hypothetical protein FOA52_015185 [Chlamydomonas sp. UWO 241]
MPESRARGLQWWLEQAARSDERVGGSLPSGRRGGRAWLVSVEALARLPLWQEVARLRTVACSGEACTRSRQAPSARGNAWPARRCCLRCQPAGEAYKVGVAKRESSSVRQAPQDPSARSLPALLLHASN